LRLIQEGSIRLLSGFGSQRH